MKKRIGIILLIMAMLLSVAACGSKGDTKDTQVPAEEGKTDVKEDKTEASDTGDTIRIGLVSPVTGENSLAGEEQKQGAELAVKEINDAGGIDGKMIELVIGDEASNLEQSVLATQELLADDSINMIVGSMYSQYAIAAMPSIEEAAIPYICTGSSSGVSKENNPYTWQVRPLDTAQGKVLANFIVDEIGAKNPAIMYSTNSTFASLQEQTTEALKELGVEITDKNLFAFPEEEKNYDSYLSQIKAGDYDCLVAMSNQVPAGDICRQAQAAGIDPYEFPCIGSTSFCSSICIEGAGAAANGWYSISDWVPGGSTEKGAKFEQDFQTAYNIPSDLAAVAFYDSIYVFKEAMEIAGTTTDREAINEAMKSIDFSACISDFKYYDDHSFASTLSITRNEDGAPVTQDAIPYR